MFGTPLATAGLDWFLPGRSSLGFVSGLLLLSAAPPVNAPLPHPIHFRADPTGCAAGYLQGVKGLAPWFPIYPGTLPSMRCCECASASERWPRSSLRALIHAMTEARRMNVATE